MSLNLHPAVWRASERCGTASQTISTQHPSLDRWLPGQGWPLGSLIEILHPSAGCGEIELVAPALASLQGSLPIVLLQPPLIPNAPAWQQWQIDSRRLWWVQPRDLRDTWWCAEQILRSQSFAALLCWADPVTAPTLRRLHLCAQESSTLFFMFRPAQVSLTFSPAVLRIELAHRQDQGWSVDLLKCRGPKPPSSLILSALRAEPFEVMHHAPVDRLAPHPA
jgi:protein ImuA